MQSPWDYLDFDDHEKIHFVTDPATGLRAIIALHSTNLGPAAGGVRFWHYAAPAEALRDALRLSRGMSYKNAMAGLPLGGGKAVILANANHDKTAGLLAAFGKAIEQLGGTYVTAADVGVNIADLMEVAKHTRYVAGLPAQQGGAGGDTGPPTSYGVFLGIKAAVRHALGKQSIAGLHIAVQGAGNVASGVAHLAAQEGARISLADVDAARADRLAREIGGQKVDPEQIMTLEADIFSPNALGAILTEQSIAALGAPIVAGGANNQLAAPGDGARLQARGILYAPDYVVNAGGMINISSEYLGDADSARVTARIEQIPLRLEQIWAESASSGEDPATIADSMAMRLIGRA